MNNFPAHTYHRYHLCRLTLLRSVSLLLFTGLLFFGPSAAQAVTISQPIVELNIQPGAVINQIVQLYDDSKRGITVYPWVYNFTEDPEREGTAQLVYDPAELKPDRDWIKFEGNRLELPSDGTLVDFPYRIEVPLDGEPGTHLLALTFRSRPPMQEELEGSTVYVGSNVVTSIFLKVAGEILDKIDADFKAGTYLRRDPGLTPAELKKYFKPKKFFIKPPVEFLLTVYNQGNTHQKPDGNVRIINTLFGGSPEKLLVNPENKIILPKTDRTFAVSSFGQGFMFGKYTAKLTLLYGSPLRDITKEVSFWIVPVIELLIAFGILILAIILLMLIWYLQRQRLRQKILRELQAGRYPQPEKKQKRNK